MLKVLSKLVKKAFKNSKPVDKFQGFFMLLILGAFYLLGEQYEYSQAIDEFTNHSFAKIESLERKNQTLINLLSAFVKEKVEEGTLEKICNSIIEDEEDLVKIAEGYNCLAKIEYDKKGALAAYKAIKNISYALEANYKEEYIKSLMFFITNKDQDNQSLDDLVNSENQEVRNRALYRLSLIYSIGRVSSKEKLNYQLEKAIETKSIIIKELDKIKTKKVNVLFSLNNNSNYLSYAKNVISSILLNADLDTYYNFYILMDKEDPISEENKRNLASLNYIAPYNIEFRFMPTDTLKKHPGFENIKNRLLFGRFMVEDIFPDLDSIITLDVDLIVLRDLYKLQDQEDLGQYVLAAMSEGFKAQDKEKCKFPYDYVNAGVMVQNLKKMRELKNTELILSKYKQMQENANSRCLYSLDQDIINLLYEDKIKFISKRWNYIPAHNFATKFMPFIVHFAGIKPWVYKNLPYEYLKLLNEKYSQINYKTCEEK